MSKVKATIRMYRLNELGDCFLLTFATPASGGGKAARSHLLVDCGSFRNSSQSIARLQQITAQIKADLGGDELDVVVATHQHNDHVSGFLHCQPDFQAMRVGQVWLSWLDDPADPTAREIGKEYHNLRLQLIDAAKSLQQLAARRKPGPTAARSIEVLTDMMGFSGLAAAGEPAEVPANAVGVLKTLGKDEPRYLKPGRVLELPGLPAGTVRVHVLGPPRDRGSLFRKDPRTGESYDPSLTFNARVATQLRAAAVSHAAADAVPDDYPFAPRNKCPAAGPLSPQLAAVVERYEAKQGNWRRIDDEWMRQAAGLALFLGDFTNNSSLVLAIELVASRKVLLFAADAQTGNWASWGAVEWPAGHPGTDDLLARTVFYKVGHHASHNATLKPVFEKMGGTDLVAFIPVNKQDPNITKPGGWKMPAAGLFSRLVQRAEGRVLQMDGVDPKECDPAKAARAAWKRVRLTPKVTDNAIAVVIPG